MAEKSKVDKHKHRNTVIRTFKEKTPEGSEKKTRKSVRSPVYAEAEKVQRDFVEEMEYVIVDKQIGRPRKEIDWSAFRAMCAVHATHREICCYLGVDDQTLKAHVETEYGRSFREVYEELSTVCKISLRRSQLILAEKNVPMAIFLGKQLLGQSDNPERLDTTAKSQFQKLDGQMIEIYESSKPKSDES